VFYSFNLDDHLPRDNLLGGIDRFLDLADRCRRLAPFYSHTGRRSVDPELLVLVKQQSNPNGGSPLGTAPAAGWAG